MPRIASLGLGVTLLLIAGVTSGCTSLPAATSSSSPAPARADAASSAYDMRLGEVEPGTTPGTLKTSIYVPTFSGVWLRMSELAPDGMFTRDFCQVIVTDTVQSSSDACSAEVVRDENGDLEGVVLNVDGLDETGYFETDARKLRQKDGVWSAETATRAVELWGFLSRKGEFK